MNSSILIRPWSPGWPVRVVVVIIIVAAVSHWDPAAVPPIIIGIALAAWLAAARAASAVRAR